MLLKKQFKGGVSVSQAVLQNMPYLPSANLMRPDCPSLLSAFTHIHAAGEFEHLLGLWAGEVKM